MPLIMLILGSLPFVELSSVRKYAICSLMTGPLILIGTTPLCHGGILSDDLTVSIVAFCSQFHVYVRSFLPSVYNSFFFVPSIRNRELFCISMPKISSVLGSLLQIIKLCVNLNSAILKCRAVMPKADIREPSPVFNLDVVHCMGVL